MIPFWAVVKKELASVARDRTIVIAILIQLFIASFSSTLLLGMLSFYDPDTIMQASGGAIKIGMVSPTPSPLETYLTERGLRVIPYPSLGEAQAGFYSNQVNAIIVIPADITTTAEIQLYLPELDALSSLIRMVIQDPLKQYENYLRGQNGIEVRYTGLKGKPATSYEFIYSVLLPMLMLFPAFIAGSMSIDALTEEVENNTLPTLLSAPLTIEGTVSAKIVAAIILSFMQCVAWLALLQLNHIAIHNLGWIIALAVVMSGITSTIAMTGAVMLKDRERSQFIYSLMLLAGAAISTALNLSPITALSRLAIGDPYTGGWNVALFVAVLGGMHLALVRMSRRLVG